ncbi:MAG: tetratricopeptide repeat protein [Candidatus Eisenbacteria bacterium]|nr:tetratricopeptide repeat protein [Candidatus Eisenbacteria bacterium]
MFRSPGTRWLDAEAHLNLIPAGTGACKRHAVGVERQVHGPRPRTGCTGPSGFCGRAGGRWCVGIRHAVAAPLTSRSPHARLLVRRGAGGGGPVRDPRQGQRGHAEGRVGRRKRISKKDLKHDALVESVSKSARFVEDHLNKVLIGAVAVLVVVFVVGMVIRSRRATELEANAALVTATQTLNSGLYGQASTLLNEVITQYPGTRSAQAATCYLGTVHYHQGDYQQALDRFEDYLARSRANGTLRTIALEGKAAVLEERNDFAAAAALYEQLARESAALPPVQARYLVEAMHTYRADGQWDRVADTARRIIDEFPETRAVGEARMILAEANAIAGA